jgi:hypothetical protein
MAAKKSKAVPIDDELGELFEGIGEDSGPRKSTSKGRPSASKGHSDPPDDIFAEIQNQLDHPPARPHTPRIKDGSKSKRNSTQTPPPVTSGRVSEDKSTAPRRSGESAHASFTPSATSSELQENEKKGTVEQAQAPGPVVSPSRVGGGGWLSGFMKTAVESASAVVERAEKGYKELQQNEEARKNLVGQAAGNLGALRSYLGEYLDILLPPAWSPTNTLLHQATNGPPGLSQPSPTFYTRSLPPSHRTSVS